MLKAKTKVNKFSESNLTGQTGKEDEMLYIKTRIIRRQDKEMHVIPVNHLIWCRKLSDIEGNRMVGSGEEERDTIRPEFDRSIMINHLIEWKIVQCATS